MKKILYFLCILSSCFLGCDDKEEESDAVIELITPQMMTFTGPSTATIQFKSSSSWEVVSYNGAEENSGTPDWIEFDRLSGEEGENAVVIRITKSNIEHDIRTAVVAIKGSGKAKQTINIFQSPGPKGEKLISSIDITPNTSDTVTGRFEFTYRFQTVSSLHEDYDSTLVSIFFMYDNLQSSMALYGNNLHYGFSVNGVAECFAQPTVEYKFPGIIAGYTGTKFCWTLTPGKEDMNRKFTYDNSGYLLKISDEPLQIETSFFWDGDKISTIQKNGDVYSFSYTAKQANDLNIDLFYFMMYGIFEWDEYVSLFGVTGKRTHYLPELMRLPGKQYEFTYERDADGYIIKIGMKDKLSNFSSVWKINYGDLPDVR